MLKWYEIDHPLIVVKTHGIFGFRCIIYNEGDCFYPVGDYYSEYYNFETLEEAKQAVEEFYKSRLEQEMKRII
jgi:hypothetical protein